MSTVLERPELVVCVPAFEPALRALPVLGDLFASAPLALVFDFREGFGVHSLTRMMVAAMIAMMKKPMRNLIVKSGLKMSLLNTPL